jgi:hypothetical protein
MTRSGTGLVHSSLNRPLPIPKVMDAVLRALNDALNTPYAGLWLFLVGFATITPAVLVHEVGHAIAARLLLPGRVWVNVGRPRGRAFRFSVGDVEFRVGAPQLAFEMAGACFYDPTGLTRRRAAAIALAGPAATLALLVGSAWLASLAEGTLRFTLVLVAISNAITLGISLLPVELTRRRGERGFKTDGRRALDALRSR